MPYRHYDPPFTDSLGGLLGQVEEYKALAKLTDALLSEDRDLHRKSPRTSTFTAVSGVIEDWQYPEFDRPLFSAFIVLSWELFHDFLAEEPRAHSRFDPSTLAPARLDFKSIRRWYADQLRIDLTLITDWSHVEQMRLTRHAIVHNRGLYTEGYISGPARIPPRDVDWPGSPLPGDPPIPWSWSWDELYEALLPIDLGLTCHYLDVLGVAATETRAALDTTLGPVR